jgi:ComF family protein
LLALALPREESFDAIVPMPLHWRKRWQRGFNQAGLLAHEVSRRTHTPVRNVLRRVRFTGTQAGLTNAKRRANVSGAFRPKRATMLRGQRVLLVDDVMTTGSTAAALRPRSENGGCATRGAAHRGSHRSPLRIRFTT